jgi:hypothetical protein
MIGKLYNLGMVAALLRATAAASLAADVPAAAALSDPKVAAPAAKEAAGGGGERPEIVALSSTRSRLGLIEFDHVSREVLIPAQVNMERGILEYVLVSEKGKLHEALLSTAARPFDLNVVLLLLNYQPDSEWWVPPAKPKPLSRVGMKARLEVFVRWRDGEAGDEKTVRLDEWISDLVTDKPAAPTPWIYTGSYFNEDQQFVAEADGSFLALYHDGRSLINNPREGADNDEQWGPASGIPSKGTPVVVVLKPVAASTGK